MARLRKVVFPVAGLGTRFLPATKVVAKEMLPVLDRPLIQYAVDEAVDAGADTLVFVTNRYKHSIADYFDSAYELEETLERAGKRELLAMVQGLLPPHVRCVYVTQEQALGLGHAVLCAKTVIGDEPFGIILPDDLIVNDGPGALRQMVARATDGGGVLAVEEVPHAETGKYGIVDVEAKALGGWSASAPAAPINLSRGPGAVVIEMMATSHYAAKEGSAEGRFLDGHGRRRGRR